MNQKKVSVHGRKLLNLFKLSLPCIHWNGATRFLPQQLIMRMTWAREVGPGM